MSVPPPMSLARPAIDPAEGEQGEDAAFAAIVRPRHERDVLHAHDEHQRPEDQREHAEHAAGASAGRQARAGIRACV